MKTARKSGKIQVGADMQPGLFAAFLAFCEKEGLSQSTVIRRAVMHEIGTDALGEPITAARPEVAA